MYKGFILISILLLNVSACFAQIKLSVQVDENRISADDFLHLQYTIEHAKKITKFIPPTFSGFKVIQGPDYSNGWTLINGEMKEYVAISFVLQPIRKGKFVIQPASVTADGQRLRSGSVAVEVTDPGNNAYIQTDKQAGNQPLNDMILKEGENINQKIKNNLFLRLELDKTSVFVGEPIVATYKLYTRLNSESKVTRRPSFSGFSVFDMADPESEQAHYETLNGREYNVYLLRKVQLFPLQEGNYELESIQVDNTVSFIKSSFARNQNTLNEILSAFGEEGIGPAAWVKEQVTINSEPKVITVKALPVLNQPLG
ncbi:MAG: BatD family protein, partial [Chitinophagaceae bacterium]